MIKAKFNGFFLEDNGMDSWKLGNFENNFKDWNHALKFGGMIQTETDMVLLSVTNLKTGEVQNF